jgi:SecD/SecF fusion protein
MTSEHDGKKAETKLVVKKKPDLLGNHVTRAGAGYGPEGWEVDLEFDSEGAAQFGKLTEQVYNEKSAMAIVLDNQIISAPGVRNGPIYGGRAQISGGNMGEKEARNLASVLENPLQVPVSIEEERSVSPTLGLDSIRASIRAGLIGLAVTLLFVAIYYRFAGMVVNLALIINLILLLGEFQLIPGGVVLTLPGIAGIILTIGMAVDASVLIYERLREELASGKPLRSALPAAYDKAFSSIFDANVTTLITATILFFYASGPVKGFAIVLMLGIIASLFTALIVGRNALGWLVETGRLTKLTMLHLISPKNWNFLGKGWIAGLCSFALIIAGAAAFYARGEKNFGVDFRGGDLATLSAPHKVELAKVRDSLNQVGLADAAIQQSQQGDRSYITIRTPLNTSDKVEHQIMQSFPQEGFKIEGSERVGALVGGELARSSLIALGLGMLGILIYVTFRFEFSFAIGAIVALLHDVLITIGMFALLGRELTLTMVGAILTIAGYSINDTIVVYDRIREGLASTRKGSVEQIMNESVNQTLSRTILTSSTTLVPILCLYFFGGAVLKDFALAIIIGIIVGTYSSVFIASPIVLWWTRARGGNASSLRREVTHKTSITTPSTAG